MAIVQASFDEGLRLKCAFSRSKILILLAFGPAWTEGGRWEQLRFQQVAASEVQRKKT